MLQYPTWPVEWQQTSPYLGWQDYMATGQPDLALAFEHTMYTRTKVGFLGGCHEYACCSASETCTKGKGCN